MMTCSMVTRMMTVWIKMETSACIKMASWRMVLTTLAMALVIAAEVAGRTAFQLSTVILTRYTRDVSHRTALLTKDPLTTDSNTPCTKTNNCWPTLTRACTLLLAIQQVRLTPPQDKSPLTTFLASREGLAVWSARGDEDTTSSTPKKKRIAATTPPMTNHLTTLRALMRMNQTTDWTVRMTSIAPTMPLSAPFSTTLSPGDIAV